MQKSEEEAPCAQSSPILTLPMPTNHFPLLILRTQSQDFGKRCKRLKGMPWWARLATAGAVTVAAVVCAVWGVRRGAPPFGRVSPPGGRVFFTRSRRYDRMHFWPAGRLMEKQ